MTTMRAPGETLGGKKINETATISGLLFLNVSMYLCLFALHYIALHCHWFVIVTMIEFTLEKVLTILDNETYQWINLELARYCMQSCH